MLFALLLASALASPPKAIEFALHELPVQLALSPDGRWLAIAGEGMLAIRDARTLALVHAPLPDLDRWSEVRWSDDSAVLTATRSGGIQIDYPLATGTPTRIEDGEYCCDIYGLSRDWAGAPGDQWSSPPDPAVLDQLTDLPAGARPFVHRVLERDGTTWVATSRGELGVFDGGMVAWLPGAAMVRGSLVSDRVLALEHIDHLSFWDLDKHAPLASLDLPGARMVAGIQPLVLDREGALWSLRKVTRKKVRITKRIDELPEVIATDGALFVQSLDGAWLIGWVPPSFGRPSAVSVWDLDTLDHVATQPVVSARSALVKPGDLACGDLVFAISPDGVELCRQQLALPNLEFGLSPLAIANGRWWHDQTSFTVQSTPAGDCLTLREGSEIRAEFACGGTHQADGQERGGTKVAWSPEGGRVLWDSGRRGALQVWNTAALEQPQRLSTTD